jgi:hypothetical protein
MPGKITFPQALNLQIAIIGLGANGSHFFRGLCQDLRTHFNAQRQSHSRNFYLEHIMLVDGDRVEEKNLGNQIFEPEEVGQYKVQALSERYGNFYCLEVLRKMEYIQSIEELHALMQLQGEGGSVMFLPVVVGMVDNDASRQIFDNYFRSDLAETLLYIDAGVHSVTLDRFNKPNLDSGNGGQVCIGLKVGGVIVMEPIGTLYPEVLADTESRVPGCGEAIKSAPQRGATNKMAAQIANNIINVLLTDRSILVHQVTFDARLCGSRPEFVTIAEQEAFDQRIRELQYPVMNPIRTNMESSEEDEDAIDDEDKDEDEWDEEDEDL